MWAEAWQRRGREIMLDLEDLRLQQEFERATKASSDNDGAFVRGGAGKINALYSTAI
jgi:hypothetical protein